MQVSNINLNQNRLKGKTYAPVFQAKKKFVANDTKDHPSFFKKVLGYFGAAYTLSGVRLLLSLPLGLAVMMGLKKYPEKNSGEIAEAAQNVLKQTGLDKKGLRLFFADQGNENLLTKQVYRTILKSQPKSAFARFKQNMTEKMLKGYTRKISKLMPDNKDLQNINLKTVYKFISKFYSSMIRKGLNAFYLSKTNFAATARNKASLIFHEIGHASTANSSRLAKRLQGLVRRMPKLAMLPLGLIAFCHTNIKSKPASEKSKFTKTMDFVKDNAGKIVTLSFLPLVAEEALASFKGVNYARKVLGNKQAAKIGLLYTLALSSYAGTALISGYAMKVASKVRDKIVYPNEYQRQKQAA